MKEISPVLSDEKAIRKSALTSSKTKETPTGGSYLKKGTSGGTRKAQGGPIPEENCERAALRGDKKIPTKVGHRRGGDDRKKEEPQSNSEKMFG